MYVTMRSHIHVITDTKCNQVIDRLYRQGDIENISISDSSSLFKGSNELLVTFRFRTDELQLPIDMIIFTKCIDGVQYVKKITFEIQKISLLHTIKIKDRLYRLKDQLIHPMDQITYTMESDNKY